jgi:hypothetical protein
MYDRRFEALRAIDDDPWVNDPQVAPTKPNFGTIFERTCRNPALDSKSSSVISQSCASSVFK